MSYDPSGEIKKMRKLIDPFGDIKKLRESAETPECIRQIQRMQEAQKQWTFVNPEVEQMKRMNEAERLNRGDVGSEYKSLIDQVFEARREREQLMSSPLTELYNEIERHTKLYQVPNLKTLGIDTTWTDIVTNFLALEAGIQSWYPENELLNDLSDIAREEDINDDLMEYEPLSPEADWAAEFISQPESLHQHPRVNFLQFPSPGVF